MGAPKGATRADGWCERGWRPSCRDKTSTELYGFGGHSGAVVGGGGYYASAAEMALPYKNRTEAYLTLLQRSLEAFEANPISLGES